MIINSGREHDFPEMLLGIVFLLILMPHVHIAVLELLKDQTSQYSQIGQSEFQIKVLSQYVSGITEETRVKLFSHNHTMKKT